MPSDSGYVKTPSDRAILLAGPLGAVLMLGGDLTGGKLSLVEHPPDPGRLAERADHYGLDLDRASIPRLAAAHGLRVPGAPPGTG